MFKNVYFTKYLRETAPVFFGQRSSSTFILVMRDITYILNVEYDKFDFGFSI